MGLKGPPTGSYRRRAATDRKRGRRDNGGRTTEDLGPGGNHRLQPTVLLNEKKVAPHCKCFDDDAAIPGYTDKGQRASGRRRPHPDNALRLFHSAFSMRPNCSAGQRPNPIPAWANGPGSWGIFKGRAEGPVHSEVGRAFRPPPGGRRFPGALPQALTGPRRWRSDRPALASPCKRRGIRTSPSPRNSSWPRIPDTGGERAGGARRRRAACRTSGAALR